MSHLYSSIYPERNFNNSPLAVSKCDFPTMINLKLDKVQRAVYIPVFHKSIFHVNSGSQYENVYVSQISGKFSDISGLL